MKNDEYLSYRKLTPKQKLQKIKEAKQHEGFRRPNPQGAQKFSEQDFIEYHVYQNKNRIKLHTYRNYKSKDTSDAKAVVIMFHGYNSHIGHGAQIAKSLQQINIITVGFDHRGFGKSEGIRGYVSSLDSHLFDAKNFAVMIRQLYPKLPLYVLGLSMGGLTSYHLALENPEMFKGAILFAPALKNILPKITRSAINILCSLLPGTFQVTRPPKGIIWKNPTISEWVVQDPYICKQRPRISSLKMLFDAMENSSKGYTKFTCPLLIIQGALDKLVHPQGAFQLYDQAQSKDKELWFYNDLWHGIWHEQQIFEILERVKKWFQQRLP